MSNFSNNRGMNAPSGINIAHTSFGQQQGTYNPSFQSQTQLKNDPDSIHRKGKPGGGWDDDDDVQPSLNTGSNFGSLNKPTYGTSTTTNTTTTTTTSNITSTNTTGGSFSFASKSTKLGDLELVDVDEKFLQNHEYEHKLISDTIQPGGARIKQADATLSTFLKASETLSVSVVGSIIISKLRSELVFVSKARAIYDIEALVKKYARYFDFFKQNLPALKSLDFAQTEGNSSYVSQLNTILQSVTKFIEDPQAATAKPITQNQPYSPNIQTVDSPNLLDDEPAPQKKENAFSFIKSNQGSSQIQSSTDTSPKKTNAFGFISKTNSAPETTAQQPQFQQQQQQQQQQQKKNAFGFISQPQTTQTTQPQQQQQQQQTKAGNQSRYEFLDMDFSDNSNNTISSQNPAPNTSQNKPSGGFGGGLDFGTSNQQQGGFGGGFGTSNQQQQQQGGWNSGFGTTNQQQGGFSGGFGTSNQQQQGGFSGGFGTSNQQQQQQGGWSSGFGTTNQQQGGFNGGFGTGSNQSYGNGFGTGQNSYNAGGYNQPSNMGYNQGFNQNAGGFNQGAGSYNYQGMQQQFSNLNLGLDANNEAEAQKKKQQQEQESKFFDFVKF